jgi:cell division protein FtsL
MKHLSRLPHQLTICFLAALLVFIFVFSQGKAADKPLKQRVSELEERIRDLQEDNDKLVYEVAKLRRTIKTTETKGNKAQSKRTAVSKVKRLPQGRPQRKDMMIGVTQLISVWDQMDLILDKLDEITTHISN